MSLNGVQVCHEGDFAIRDPGETSCAKFEMSGNGTGGRWDGVLTVYPQYSSNEIRVDIEFDEPVWALVVRNMKQVRGLDKNSSINSIEWPRGNKDFRSEKVHDFRTENCSFRRKLAN